MDNQQQSLEDLQHIKKMMERSSRFISLSGLSGISAGVCALAGAWFASREFNFAMPASGRGRLEGIVLDDSIDKLLWIGTLTFIAAFVSAFIFTYLRSKKNGTPIWGSTTVRLLWNTLIPVAVGGIFLIRLMDFGHYEMVAPGCLIFYGLALVNASKYTLGEVRYLGYGQIVLGILNLWWLGYGLQFWAMGFGILHIVYGTMMWWKYERK